VGLFRITGADPEDDSRAPNRFAGLGRAADQRAKCAPEEARPRIAPEHSGQVRPPVFTKAKRGSVRVSLRPARREMPRWRDTPGVRRAFPPYKVQFFKNADLGLRIGATVLFQYKTIP
jgi:hypothetical protein